MTDLKALRKRLGLSQAEMAKRLGIDQATVSRIEAEKARPSGPVQILIGALASQPTPPTAEQGRAA